MSLSSMASYVNCTYKVLWLRMFGGEGYRVNFINICGLLIPKTGLIAYKNLHMMLLLLKLISYKTAVPQHLTGSV